MPIRTLDICAAGTCILLGGAPLFVVTAEMVDELFHQPCYSRCAAQPFEALMAPHPEEGSSATGSWEMAPPLYALTTGFSTTITPTAALLTATGHAPTVVVATT